MTQERPREQLSTEVIGQLTDPQRQELGILGISIFDAKKLDPKSPDHVSQVRGIVEDCVYRGLDVQGRVWFSAGESVSPIFEAGLVQRETITDQLKRIGTVGTHLKYVTSEEVGAISQVTPLAPDFEPADELYAELRGRRAAVSKFHQALFDESQLAPEARALKDSIEVVSSNIVTPQDREWMKNNMLYGNLLVNLALYQQIGLTVEPKDIAAISDIWKDFDVRDRRQTDMIERMKTAAKNLGIPERHIEAYTRNILDHINVTVISGRVTLEELQVTDLFAIPTQAILEESLEFEQPDEGEYQTSRIPEEDLVDARSEIITLHEMFDRIDKIAEETEDQEDDSEDSELNRFVTDTYIPHIRQIEPVALYFTYHQGLQPDQPNGAFNYPRLEEELQEFVPFDTYLDTLIMLQAKEFKVMETGETIPELTEEARGAAYTAIKDQVLLKVLEEKFGDGTTYADVVDKLPTAVLGEYMEKIDPVNLPEDHRNALNSVDEQKWLGIAIARGVHAEADPNKAGEVKLVFSPDSDFLQKYFAQMPGDKQQTIAKKLQHIIVF